MKTIEDYKMANGRYDTTQIRQDAGLSERAARFDDIFGSATEDQQEATILPAPFQALVEEAERRNVALSQATPMVEETVEALTVAVQSARTDDQKYALRMRRARVVAGMSAEAIDAAYANCIAIERSGRQTLLQSDIRRVYEDFRQVHQQDFVVWCGNVQQGDSLFKGAAPLKVVEVLEVDTTPVHYTDEEDLDMFESMSPRTARCRVVFDLED